MAPMRPSHPDDVTLGEIYRLLLEVREEVEKTNGRLQTAEREIDRHGGRLTNVEKEVFERVFRRISDVPSQQPAITTPREGDHTGLRQLLIGIGTLVLVGWGLVQGAFKIGDLLQKLGWR